MSLTATYFQLKLLPDIVSGGQFLKFPGEHAPDPLTGAYSEYASHTLCKLGQHSVC